MGDTERMSQNLIWDVACMETGENPVGGMMRNRHDTLFCGERSCLNCVGENLCDGVVYVLETVQREIA